MALLIASVAGVPFLTAVLILASQRKSLMEKINGFGSVATTLLALLVVKNVVNFGPQTSFHQFFYVDALSAVVMTIISLVGLTAALHSIGYIRLERLEGALDDRQFRLYYALYHLFIGTMMMVTIFNNLGLLWVSIEATTLVSAFLIAIYRKGEALEATWKYLMVCSAGIVFALLGIVILYIAVIQVLGPSNQVLNWTTLANPQLHLQPELATLAFAFIMVGLGTKVGLFPMHFWLPDAHSQAPSPVSAVLSGVLLNCAMLGLIRFEIIAQHSVPGHFIQDLFIWFGVLSIIVAFPFILVQQDLKRMLAFSTVEHMGIISVAVGIGGAVGFSAAMLQMFNHAMGKSLLFLLAGNLNQKYRTKSMVRIAGALRVMPFTGPIFLLASLAITGAPPFSIFTSEFAIFVAGFQNGHSVVTSVSLIFVALIFTAMMFHLLKMSFGSASREKLSIGELSGWHTYPLVVPLAFVVLFGLYQPHIAGTLIHQATRVMLGGRLS